MNMTTKKCCACKATKALNEFGVLRGSKDGHAKRCKPCARLAVATTKAKPVAEREKRPLTPKSRAQISRDYRARHPGLAAARRREWYAKNRAAVLAKAKVNAHKKAAEKAYRLRTKDAEKARQEKWRAEKPEMSRAKTARWRERNPNASKDYYRRNRLAAMVRYADRRAKQLSATPAWRDHFIIGEVYDLARRRSRLTGLPWEVDHIVPLKSPVVCGLHAHTNLQVIPRALNKLKGNRHHG